MKKVIGIITGIILVAGAIYGISLPELTPEERLNKIGNYELSHYINSEKVFLLATPRGVEYVLGEENLQYSLDTYRKNGTYGKEL